MRCKRKIIRILGLWLFIVFPAMAQVLTGEAAPAVEAPPQPEFFQPADIPSASDRDHGKILELQQQSLPEEEINNIRSRVEALAESRKKLIAQKDFKHPERLNAQVQTNNALQLSTQKKAHDDLKKLIDRHSSALQQNRDSMRSMREIWEETLKQSESLDLASAMQQRVENIIKEINSQDKNESSKINVLLELHQQVTDGEKEITATLELYKQLKKGEKEGVFSQNLTPMWHGLDVNGGTQSVLDSLQFSYKNNLETVKDFVSQQQSRLTFDVLIVIMLLAIISWLRKYRETWQQDESLSAAVHILSKPVAASILVLIIISPMIFGRVPPVIEWIIGLAMALAAIRILYGLMPTRYRMHLIVLALFYTLLDIPELVLDNRLMERIIVLSISLLAFLYLLMGDKSERIGTGTTSGGLPFYSPIRRMITLFLGVSILANITGYFDLARLLVYGSIHSLFSAVLLYASVLVMQGIFALLLRTHTMGSLKSIGKHRTLIQKRFVSILQTIAKLWWLLIVLSEFHLLDIIYSAISSALGHRLVVGSIDVSLTDILLFFITVWISVWVSRFIHFVLQEEVFHHVKLPRGVPSTISMLTHYSIIGIGLMIAFSVAGIELSKFAIVAGALGVGIGFGLQNIVNNFVSGLILAFERPIQSGDTIETGSLMGTVKRIGFRSSTVRTFDGAEVIVPNANLVSSEVTNWTLSDKLRRIEIGVGVAYGTDPETVIELLQKLALQDEKVLPDPAPYALFTEHGESSLDFILRFWTSEFDDWLFIRSRVNMAINRALTEAGIEIPFPQRDVHLKTQQASAAAETD
jgi:small-conductance mechanosensitive channel